MFHSFFAKHLFVQPVSPGVGDSDRDLETYLFRQRVPFTPVGLVKDAIKLTHESDRRIPSIKILVNQRVAIINLGTVCANDDAHLTRVAIVDRIRHVVGIIAQCESRVILVVDRYHNISVIALD